MPALWEVEVTDVAGRQVRLRLARLHPDAGPFSDSAAFALRLLHMPALDIEPSGALVPMGPLGEAVGDDDVHDANWIATHAGQYVEHVDVQPQGRSASYLIEATDPRWLYHLRPGQRWRSAAYG